MLTNDFRYAARSLARMRSGAAVAILTLALGIGATTTMFSVVYAALLRPLPFAEPDRLVMLHVLRTTPQDGLVRLRWSMPAAVTLAASVSSFESLATVTGASIALSGASAATANAQGTTGMPEQLDGELVSANYFAALRVTPAAGRFFLPDEDVSAGAHPLAIVSDRLWRRRFAADPAIVGGIIRVNDVALTVVGIAPPGFSGVTGKGDIFMPRTMAPVLTYAEYLTTPQHFISVVARLRAGVSLAQANAELAAIGSRFADPSTSSRQAPSIGSGQVGSRPGTQWNVAAMPIGEARVDPTLRRSVLVLLAAAGCVLLIACVNVAALMLARARTRRREIAIRLAIGSSRLRLVRGLLVEGLLLAAIAGFCGTVAATWGVALFAKASPAVVASFGNNYSAVGVFAAPSLDLRVLMFAAAATLLTTMLFALAPAIDASRPDLVAALKEDDRGGGRGRALGALVISEVGLAVLLLGASGLLLETFARLQSRRTGFITDNVLTFWVRPPASRYAPADGPAALDRLLARVQSVAGVESAAVNRCTPFTGCARSVMFMPGADTRADEAPAVGRHYISADYFKALGIPLLAGRGLTAADRAGAPPVAVVNEAGARRFWPGENVIGKRVWFGTTTGPFSDPAHAVEIVGVVGDVKYEGVEQADNPSRAADFYTSYLQFAYPDTMVIVKARGDALSLLPAMRAAVAAFDPVVPIYDAMTLDERIAAAISRPRFNATLVAAFAVAALLLAAIGVYGVLSYSVSARMREIGVRLALGAGAGGVTRLVLGQGLKLAAIGAAAGIGAAFVGARLIRSLLVGAAPSSLRVLLGGALVMLASAAVAAWLPARRAAAVDPIVVLRDQ
jgi:putative ABC transport system permease protein